jgi:uncharacterized membrane protein
MPVAKRAGMTQLKAMTLMPLLAAPASIQIHAYATFIALLLGIAQMGRSKGTTSHRFFGYGWVLAMALAAVSSFWISVPTWRLIGPFGPVHLLSVAVLLMLPLAIIAAQKGQIARHRRFMQGMFWIGLVVTGLFTLAPGRIMHKVMFGG